MITQVEKNLADQDCATEHSGVVFCEFSWVVLLRAKPVLYEARSLRIRAESIEGVDKRWIRVFLLLIIIVLIFKQLHRFWEQVLMLVYKLIKAYGLCLDVVIFYHFDC